jgi:hypothetical protein
VLQVRAGEEWKDATLDGVASRLKGFLEEQDAEMKKTGASALETLPGGTKVSRLFLSLEVEPTVPWQHVQWLMIVAAEQRYYKLELSDGVRRTLVSLPADRDPRPQPGGPPVEIRAPVHVLCRREKLAKWGDLQVFRPTEVRHRIGDSETSALKDVIDGLRVVKGAAAGTEKVPLVGEIKAGHKVPFSHVLDVMEAFDAAGIPSVAIHASALPGDQRQAPRLRFPPRNYDVVD